MSHTLPSATIESKFLELRSITLRLNDGFSDSSSRSSSSSSSVPDTAVPAFAIFVAVVAETASAPVTNVIGKVPRQQQLISMAKHAITIVVKGLE